MGIPGHILTSAAAVSVAFVMTRSVSLGLGVAAGSLLLDADHLLDYVLIDKQRSLNPLRVLTYYRKYFPLRRLLLLHSYELLALLLGLAFVSGSKALGGFALGSLVHLGTDILPRSDLTLWSRIRLYSLAYRWHHGFSSSRLYHHVPTPESLISTSSSFRSR